MPPWKKNYYLYQSAMFISLLGDFLGSMALHWWLLKHSEGIGALSSVFLVSNVVRLVSLPLFGPLGDRFPRKNVLNFADTISSLLCLSLAFFVFFGNTNIFLLCLLMGFSALAGSLFRAGSYGMVPELVPAEHLTWAISQNQMIFTISIVIGGATGSLFISLFGVFWTLVLNALAIGLAILLIRKIDMTAAMIVSDHREISLREWVNDFVSGIQFIKKDKVILTSFVILFLVNSLLTPFDLLLPYYVQKIRLATIWEFGLIESSIGIGSILGALIFNVTGFKDNSLRIVLGAITFMAFSFAAFGFMKSLVALMFLSTCIGVGESLFFIPLRTKMTLIIPHRFRSRVGMIFLFGQQIGKPIAISMTTLLIKSFAVSTILTYTSLLMVSIIPTIFLLPFYVRFLNEKPIVQEPSTGLPLLQPEPQKN